MWRECTRQVDAVLEVGETLQQAFDKINNPDAEPQKRHCFVRAWDYVTTSVSLRAHCASLGAMLRRVAATGRADVYTEEGLSPAFFAVRCGKTEMVKELVLRGNNPNQVIVVCASDDPEEASYETLFQSAMACMPFMTGDLPPLEQRLELLGWLLEHGADINDRAVQGRGYMTMLIATIAAMRENDKLPAEKQGALMEWLLDHGLQPEACRQPGLLGTYFSYCSAEVVRRIGAKLRLSEMTPAHKADILRGVLGGHSGEKPQIVRWAVEQLGAEPNLIRTCDGEPDLRVILHTMDKFAQCAFAQKGNAPVSEEEKKEFAIELETLDILLAHGAHLYDAQSFAPAEPAWRELYLDVLKKHGQDPEALKDPQLLELCRWMEQTGTLPKVQQWLAQQPEKPNYLVLNELMKATISRCPEDAPEKLRWLLAEGAAVDDERLEICWSAAWQKLRRLEHMSPEKQAEAFKLLQVLSDLLAAGMRIGYISREEPADPALLARFREILNEHKLLSEDL